MVGDIESAPSLLDHLKRNNHSTEPSSSLEESSSLLQQQRCSKDEDKYEDYSVVTATSTSTSAASYSSATAAAAAASTSINSSSTPSSYWTLTILSLTMFICFGIHNLLQEAIMKTPGFKFGVMLGYMEVLGVTFFSYLERRFVAKEHLQPEPGLGQGQGIPLMNKSKSKSTTLSSKNNKKTHAPMQAYFLLTLCLMTSSSLSNLSLNFINFPTKVIFRSCKLIPTMIIATLINKQTFSTFEYICAFSISLGLIIFTVVDWTLTPVFHPIGIFFVSVSVFADAILPNAQERLFRMGSSRLEVTFFTNLFTLVAMTFTTFMSGDMVHLFKLIISSSSSNDNNNNENHEQYNENYYDESINNNNDDHGMLTMYLIVYTLISYFAVSSFMLIVKKFGGVTAVLLGTARKAMTLILSFCFFPKAFSIYYVIGTLLVLGGLLLGSLHKLEKKKKKKKEKIMEKKLDWKNDHS